MPVKREWKLSYSCTQHSAKKQFRKETLQCLKSLHILVRKTENKRKLIPYTSAINRLFNIFSTLDEHEKLSLVEKISNNPILQNGTSDSFENLSKHEPNDILYNITYHLQLWVVHYITTLRKKYLPRLASYTCIQYTTNNCRQYNHTLQKIVLPK